ncbi:MAG: FliM/FliN family flagellar motor switch protein [Phycisphaerales bacterium]
MSMASDIRTILKLEVPVVVQLGTRQLRVSEVVALQPGAIIELAKRAEDPLDLMVNNKVVGTGKAVKVGENFGLRVATIGDARARLTALATPPESAAVAGSLSATDAPATAPLAA